MFNKNIVSKQISSMMSNYVLFVSFDVLLKNFVALRNHFLFLVENENKFIDGGKCLLYTRQEQGTSESCETYVVFKYEVF